MFNHGHTGEGWYKCDRCDNIRPMSMLVKQKGVRLCTDQCGPDNLDIERRQIEISLKRAQNQMEGADVRFLNETNGEEVW